MGFSVCMFYESKSKLLLCLSKWIGTRKTISALKDKEKIPKKAKAQTSLTNINSKLNRRRFLSINGEPVTILLQPKPSQKNVNKPTPNLYSGIFIRVASLTHLTRLFVTRPLSWENLNIGHLSTTACVFVALKMKKKSKKT